MLKTYQLLRYTNSTLCFRVGKVIKHCKFGGGVNSGTIIHRGIFRTADAELQRVIESSSAYGVKFTCITIPEKKEIIPIQAVAPSASVNATEKDNADSEQYGNTEQEEIINNPKFVYDVINGQQARNYLLKVVPGLTMKEVMRNEQIRQKAASLNINFPNWQ